MTLKEKIETNYKNSLKAKNKTEISTYRLILSSIKDLDIVNRSGPDKKETDDEDIKKLLKKMIKQRTESIEIYKKNDRKDLLELYNQIDISFEEFKLIEEYFKMDKTEIMRIFKINFIPNLAKTVNKYLKLSNKKGEVMHLYFHRALMLLTAIGLTTTAQASVESHYQNTLEKVVKIQPFIWITILSHKII